MGILPLHKRTLVNVNKTINFYDLEHFGSKKTIVNSNVNMIYKCLVLNFLFIHCKTVKVSQNDQIRMLTWFTRAFLMNGTELRSFSHFQILTKIGYMDLSRKLENWLILKLVFIHCKTVKVSQDDQIRM